MKQTQAIEATRVEVVGRSNFDPKLLLKLVRNVAADAEAIRETDLEDDDDEAYAADKLRDLKALGDRIQGYYEELSRPHLDALAKLRDLVKPYKDVVTLGVAAHAAAIECYRIELARARSKALTDARTAAAQRDTKALTKSLNTAQDTKPQALEGVSVRLRWEVDVVQDVLALKAPYLLANYKALNQWAADQPADNPDKPPVMAGVTFKLGSAQRVSR